MISRYLPAATRTALSAQLVCYDCAGAGPFEADHGCPVALGGGNEPGNLFKRCVPCHAIKTKCDVKMIAKSDRIKRKREGRHRRKPLAPLNAVRKLPSQTLLRELFIYSDETGDLISKCRRGPITPGKIVGSKRSDGYVTIYVNHTRYLAHRLVWAWHHGSLKESELIDHIDRDPSNNRIENLRIVTQSQNNANQGPRAYRKLPRGVSKRKHRTGAVFYVAQITKGGDRYHLGVFDCPTAAHLAYTIALDELYGAHSSYCLTGTWRKPKGRPMQSPGFRKDVRRKFNGKVEARETV